MKEPTVKLTLAADIDERDKIYSEILKFSRAQIVEREFESYERIRAMEAKISALAERAGIKPELGYTDIMYGRTIRKTHFSGSSFDEVLSDVNAKVGSTVNALEQKVGELETIESRLQSLSSETLKLNPFFGINVDLSFLESMNRFCVKFFTSKVRINIAGALVAYVEQGGSYLGVTVCSPEREQEIVGKIALARGVLLQSPPNAIPDRRLAEISSEIKELEGSKARAEKELAALREESQDVINASVETLRLLSEVTQLGEPAGRFIIVRVEVLREDVGRFMREFKGIAMIAADEHSDELELVNNFYSSNFEPITENQGTPSRAEIDPTPIISFVFPLFFGIMFPDLGQGLIIAILGAIIYLKGWKNKKKWGAMLLSFGIAASVAGILVGEVFGFSTGNIPLIGKYLWGLRVLNVSTLTYSTIMLILMFSLMIGIIHLSSAYFIDFYQALRVSWRRAMMSKLPVFIAYVGGVLIGLSIIGGNYSFNLFGGRAALIGVPNLYLSAFSVPITAICIVIFLTYSIKLEGPINGAIAFMFIVIEFLANTISYARLGVLLMVHVILMHTLNQTAALGATSIPLLVFGNLGIMALEGLIVYIQSLRLHVYEWFTKFYTGSGKRFMPISRWLTHAEIDIK
ncbi:MAG: V-type ATPase 116kDa subunit family protein [Conexivisphaerales archaeon]